MQYFVVTNPALKEDNASVYADLRRQLVWNIVFLKASTNKPENADLKKVTTASESQVTMDVTVQSTLEEKKYLVNVSFSQKYYNVTVGNVTLRISGSRGQFGYEIPSGTGGSERGGWDRSGCR
jgi:outer membrane lipopolysaccharide assembly protein LptE/RlpB